MSIPKLPQQQPCKAKLKARPIAASARSYCVGGQLLQATLSGPCRACLVSHPRQLVPYATLGLGRDGANNLASSRLESWALDDSSVEKTPYIFRLRQHKAPTQIPRYRIKRQIHKYQRMRSFTILSSQLFTRSQFGWSFASCTLSRDFFICL